MHCLGWYGNDPCKWPEAVIHPFKILGITIGFHAFCSEVAAKRYEICCFNWVVVPRLKVPEKKNRSFGAGKSFLSSKHSRGFFLKRCGEVKFSWICLRWFFTFYYGKSPLNHHSKEYSLLFHTLSKSKNFWSLCEGLFFPGWVGLGLLFF